MLRRADVRTPVPFDVRRDAVLNEIINAGKKRPWRIRSSEDKERAKVALEIRNRRMVLVTPGSIDQPTPNRASPIRKYIIGVDSADEMFVYTRETTGRDGSVFYGMDKSLSRDEQRDLWDRTAKILKEAGLTEANRIDIFIKEVPERRKPLLEVITKLWGKR